MLNEQEWLLTVALFLPLVGAGLLVMIPAGADALIKRAAVVMTGVSFAVVAVITAGFDFRDAGTLQYETTVTWIDAIGARFHLGIDGISMPLFFLTPDLHHQAHAGARQAEGLPRPDDAGMAGTFVAFDLVLFFV